MSKIKITEAQAKLLQGLDTPKVIKITEAQFKLIESELSSIPKSKRPSLKVAKAFKQSGVTEDGEDLLGHPVAGSGGKEYNPQTVKQNKKTTKSFNEGEVNEDMDLIPTNLEFLGQTYELIKGFYNNTSQKGLSTFWVKNGFTHGELNRILTTAGFIVAGVLAGDKVVRLAKNKLSATQMVKKASSFLRSKKIEKVEAAKNTMKKREPTVHGANKPKDANDPRYSKVAEAPIGGQDSRDPALQRDPQRVEPRTPEKVILEEMYTNGKMSILKDRKGNKYLFTFDHINDEDFVDYSDAVQTTSRGDAGDTDYETDMDTLDINGEVVERYVNDNIKEIPKGKGIDGWDDGKDLNLIDNDLASKILKIWHTDENLRKILTIQETTSAGGSSGAFVAPLGTDVIRGKLKEATVPKISMFSDESGVEMKTMADVTEVEEIDEDVEEIEEVTTTGSVGGSYVGPMMWAKDKDSHEPAKKTQYPKGKFVGESNQTDTAYPDGKFVEFDDCTKLDNNKEAENGGCSTGAVDGVAKEKGSKNSVISKEALYYEIAKKTGKSEKEVETIIEGYLLNKEK